MVHWNFCNVLKMQVVFYLCNSQWVDFLIRIYKAMKNCRPESDENRSHIRIAYVGQALASKHKSK